MPTITVSVGALADDVTRRVTPDYYADTDSTVAVGRYSTTAYKYGSGIRFNNLPIPAGAVIDSAFLRGWGFRYSTTAGRSYSYLSAEDVDSAPSWPATAGAFDTRFAGRTTARVEWNPLWSTEVTERVSPDIKAVIQEVIDRPGWVSGGSIALFWEDYDGRTTSPGLHVLYSADYPSYDPPSLTITYTEPSGGIVHPVIGSGIVNSRAIVRGAA